MTTTVPTIITGHLQRSVEVTGATEARGSTMIENRDQAHRTDTDGALLHLDDKHLPMVNY